MAMNSLFKTRTLESRAGLALEFIQALSGGGTSVAGPSRGRRANSSFLTATAPRYRIVPALRRARLRRGRLYAGLSLSVSRRQPTGRFVVSLAPHPIRQRGADASI